MINHNGRSSLFMTEALAHAVLMPAKTAPSFAIPLIRSTERSNANYTPTADIFGKINGFKEVELQGKIFSLNELYQIELGQDELFSIIDPDRKVLVGTKKSLIPKIGRWIDSVDDKVVRLNFALFCGDKLRCHKLGQVVFSMKLSELGNREAAARWFVSSFICLPIIREILKANCIQAINVEETIESLVPTVKMLNSSTLAIFLPNDTPMDHLESSKSYKNTLSRMFFLASDVTGLTLTIGSYSPFANKVSEKYFEDISAFSRQERRFAEILKIYIADPAEAEIFFARYADRSAFTNRALTFAKRELGGQRTTNLSRANQIAEILPRIVRIAFPQQRGIVILELARVLGHYSQILDAIIDLGSKSRQKEIIAVIPQIKDLSKDKLKRSSAS